MVPVLFGMNPLISKVFFAVGAIAPTSLGILFAFRQRDMDYWRGFWQRVMGFRQIGIAWYGLIVLIIPVSTVVALVLNYFPTGAFPELTTLKEFVADPFRLMLFALFTIFFGPLAEELGWRGFALDQLGKGYHWLESSLVIGFFWALWHLPLAFIRDTYQYNLLNHSWLFFVIFLVDFFPTSIIMGWIYRNNGRSILSGILFHFFQNFFGEVIGIPNDIKPYRTIVLLVVAAVILWHEQKTNRNFVSFSGSRWRRWLG